MTTTLTAPDITCGGCANAIRRALGSVPGVSGIDVDVARKAVSVTHDEGVAGRAAILAALDRAGFPAADQQGTEPPTGDSNEDQP